MFYNFCRIHQSLRVTPATEAGLAAKQEHDDTEATKWLRKAADQGYPEAEYLIGGADAEGIKWWHKSAEHGYVPAQFSLGRYYMADYGPYHKVDPSDAKPDYSEAL